MDILYDRANNPVSVLDGLDLVDNTQPLSADNLPIGMRDTSYAAGTPREPQEGRCYKGNGNSIISLGERSDLEVQNFRIEFYAIFREDLVNRDYYFGISNTSTLLDTNGITLRRDVGSSGSIQLYVGDAVLNVPKTLYEFDVWTKVIITQFGGKVYIQVGDYLGQADSGTLTFSTSSGSALLASNDTDSLGNRLLRSEGSIFGFIMDELDTSGNFVQNLCFYKCDEQSGDISYDSSGNNHHGTIVNLYSGFHGTQNIWSFQNQVGFGGGIRYNLNNLSYSELTIELNVGTLYDLFFICADKDTVGNNYFVDFRNTDGSSEFLIVGPTGVVTSGFATGNLYIDGKLTNNFSKDGKDHIVEIRSYQAIREVNIITWFSRYNHIEILENFTFASIKESLSGNAIVNPKKIIDNLIPGYTISNDGVFFSRNESITLPPFKGVLGNDLQYKGKAPSRAIFVNTPCFQGDGVAYMTGDVLTTDTITAGTGSSVPTCTTDGRLDFVNGEKYYDVVIERSSVIISRLPMSFEIQDPSNHTEFDVIGGNHATLVNGSFANRGLVTRPNGDYGQLGHTVSDGVNYYYDQALTQLIPLGVKIPASASDLTKCVAYTTGGVLADLTVIQDGNSFLNTGTKLQHYPMPRVIQAEQTNRFYTDVNDDIVDKAFTDFNGDEGDDQHFNDISETGKVKNIRTHKEPLERQQLATELRITNNS